MCPSRLHLVGQKVVQLQHLHTALDAMLALDQRDETGRDGLQVGPVVAGPDLRAGLRLRRGAE